MIMTVKEYLTIMDAEFIKNLKDYISNNFLSVFMMSAGGKDRVEANNPNVLIDLLANTHLLNEYAVKIIINPIPFSVRLLSEFLKEGAFNEILFSIEINEDNLPKYVFYAYISEEHLVTNKVEKSVTDILNTMSKKEIRETLEKIKEFENRGKKLKKKEKNIVKIPKNGYFIVKDEDEIPTCH